MVDTVPDGYQLGNHRPRRLGSERVGTHPADEIIWHLGVEKLQRSVVHRVDLDQRGGVAEGIGVGVEVVEEIDHPRVSQPVKPLRNLGEVLLPDAYRCFGEEMAVPGRLLLELITEPDQHNHTEREGRGADEGAGRRGLRGVVPGEVRRNEEDGEGGREVPDAAIDEEAGDHADDDEGGRTGGSRARCPDDRGRHDDHADSPRQQHSGVLLSNGDLDSGCRSHQGCAQRLYDQVTVAGGDSENQEGDRCGGCHTRNGSNELPIEGGETQSVQRIGRGATTAHEQ